MRGGARFGGGSCRSCRIEVVRAKVVVMGSVEDELKSTVMKLMGNFKLRFPSKIAFDIGVQSFDKDIKNCIILKLLYRCEI